MRVSKQQAQENRSRIVETASVLFRERGYEGIGVAELMAAAGFTHGGFYNHFPSKADLLCEAARCGLAGSAAQVEGVAVEQFVKAYASRSHRDAPGHGCTMAALGADAARQAPEVKAVFAAGIEQLLSNLSADAASREQEGDAEQRRANLCMIAQLVGAIVLSRACPDDSDLADEILDSARQGLLSAIK